MIIPPCSLVRPAGVGSNLRATRARALTGVFVLSLLCFLLTACGSLLHTFRSADCDLIQKTEGGPTVPGRATVSGIVGKGEPTRGMGWLVREQGPQGIYFIQFDPPFSGVPKCCVETQQSSLSKLSVQAAPSAGGLHLEATHESDRCLRKEKRVEYGYVVEEKCAEWQTFQVPWNGRTKFTCVSQ